MDRFVSFLMVLSLVCLLAVPANSGVEPSPFKPEANQLFAIDEQMQSIGKRVDDKLSTPPDDMHPGVVKALESIFKKVVKLDEMQSLIVEDVLAACDPVLSCPPDDIGPVVQALLAVEGSAGLIVGAIDAFLATPPDDTLPQTFLNILLQVGLAAQSMATNAQTYASQLSEPSSCIPTDIDEFACMERVDCVWDPTDASCCCTP